MHSLLPPVMLGSSWMDTPGLPNRHYLYTSSPTVLRSSPHLSPPPCLLAACQGRVEKRPQCWVEQAVPDIPGGHFLLPAHEGVNPSSRSVG